jgi:hypothetical protein
MEARGRRLDIEEICVAFLLDILYAPPQLAAFDLPDWVSPVANILEFETRFPIAVSIRKGSRRRRDFFLRART